MIEMQKILLFTSIFFIVFSSVVFSEESTVCSSYVKSNTQRNFSIKGSDNNSDKYNINIMDIYEIKGIDTNCYRAVNELFIMNPYKSYDAKFKYTFDFNLYDKKVKLVPKLRFTQKTEKKIKTPLIQKEISSRLALDGVKKNLTSSQTNSIFIGMDLSYAIDKNIYLDSNLSFYQTALEMTNDDTKKSVSPYKFKENAMSLAIGVRKKITDRLSAGLLYSWKKWFNETNSMEKQNFEEEKNSKSAEDSSKALNLMLRYDF